MKSRVRVKPIDFQKARIILFCPIFFVALLAYGPGAGFAKTEPQSQNSLENKNILILNAFESNIPSFEKTNQALSATLSSGGIGIRNQFYEHLDLVRNPDPESRKLLLELFRQRYADRKIDFIITMFPEALEFLLEECQTIFPDAPVLSLYLPQGYEVREAGRQIILHLVIPDFKPTLEAALKLVPDAKYLYVVGGTHSLDRWLENLVRKDAKTWEGRVEFRYLTDISMEEILATAANLSPDNILFITLFSRDVKGKYQITVEVCRQLARVAKAPVFGFLETLLGQGIVGGSLISFKQIGIAAGETVLEFLGGDRKAKDLPTVLEIPQLDIFDWRQLTHWNLDESALPADSIIVNREFSLWDLKYYAIGALSFMILQSVLIGLLLVQRRHRRSAEKRLEERLMFEQLLSEISASFINLPAERIDEVIVEKQRRVCEVLGFDFSALWQLSLEYPRYFYQTHVHRPAGGPPLPDKMEAEAHFPWVLKQLMSGEIVAVSTEEAPREAERDREVWRHYGVKSSLTFPLSAGRDDLLIGALSFGAMGEERLWPAPLIKQLELLAQVFANAITRKRTDHVLRESERRFKLATDAAGAGLWIMNEETGDFWVSAKTKDLFHFLPNEKVTYERFFTAIHPDDREPVRQALDRTLQSGEHLVSEYRILPPDGSTRWIGARGQRYGGGKSFRLMGALVDITERKEMEEGLRKAAEEWQTTFDSTPDVIMILDEDFKILRHNAATISFFGLSSQEILGRHCHALMHKAKEPPLDCPVKRSLLFGKHQEEETYDVDRNAWYQLSSDPIIDREGTGTRFVHRIKDITDRMEAEAEVRKQWEHLAHVERMGIMGELTASLAHEINQPLTAIQSNAEAAKRFMTANEPNTGEVLQILKDISRDNRRAGSIISKIRAMLKKEPIPFTALDLNELIVEVLALLRTDSLLRELVIIRDLFPELPSVFADRVQLQQVIINLVLNGAAAMKHVSTDQRRLVIGTEIQGKTDVKVSVTDFGTGIDEQNTESLFEPFYTTKSNGMGMGLAISQRIIQEHGGTIEASNHPEGGAVFTFTLPAHQGDSP